MHLLNFAFRIVFSSNLINSQKTFRHRLPAFARIVAPFLVQNAERGNFRVQKLFKTLHSKTDSKSAPTVRVWTTSTILLPFLSVSGKAKVKFTNSFKKSTSRPSIARRIKRWRNQFYDQ